MQVYTDASRGENVIGVGYVIKLNNGTEMSGKRYQFVGDYSSMDAEWCALMEGLEIACEQKKDSDNNIEVVIDCRPLVRKVRDPKDFYDDKWFTYRKRVLNKLFEFRTWDLRWEKRDLTKANSAADRLAKEALWEGREQLQEPANVEAYTGSATEGLRFI